MAVAARGILAALPWRLVRQASRRLTWGVADQAMGALTNFLLSIYIARTLGAAQFGAFSLAYVTYGFAINASRGLSIEPLLIRFSGTDLPTWRRATAGCTGTALLVGLVAGACALAAGLLVGGTTGLAFLALGLTLPGLMLQDSWRHSFFALGRGYHAFINDAVWAAVLLPLLVFLKMSGHANVFWFVLAWGAGAVVGAAIGPLQARVVPNLAGAREWLSRHRDLGPRYLAENTGGNAADTVRTYAVSYILGLAAVGYIQAAGVLMGPFKIIFFGLSLITIPEAARLLRRSPRHLPLFCAAISTGLTLLALAWGAVLLVALPRGLGHLMLGSIWRPTYPLVLPATLFVLSSCASTGALVGLHALGAARRSLRAVILTSVLVIAFALVGAVTGGTLGTMYCAAAASWLGTLVCWWQFRQALHESGTIPVPGWLWPRSAGQLRVALRESGQVPTHGLYWFRHPAARHRQRRTGLDLHRRKSDTRPRRQLDPAYFRIPECPQPSPQLEARLRQRRDGLRPAQSPTPWLVQQAAPQQAKPPEPRQRQRRAYPQPWQPLWPGERRRMKMYQVPRIAGAVLFEPVPHVDERGFFCRTFDVDVMRAAGIDPAAFAQDSLSRSARGVVRGLHVRRGDGEAKLVRCLYGAIFDVVVDLRPASPTYRNWESFELRDDEQVSLYVPAGCAHGFQALTDPADVSYRIDRAHDPAEDVSIAFDDPELAIPWPLPVAAMSRRDRHAATLAAAARLLS